MATAVRGRLIRSSTKSPLIGSTVEAINVSTGVSAGSDETDSQGFFNINGLTDASYFPRPLVYGQDWDIQSDLNVLVGGSLYLPDETTTPRVQITNAAAGGIVGLGSGHTYDDTDGTGTYHFRLSQVDGKAYFGGGNATLDTDGITISGGASLAIESSITTAGLTLYTIDEAITLANSASLGLVVGLRTGVSYSGSGDVSFLFGTLADIRLEDGTGTPDVEIVAGFQASIVVDSPITTQVVAGLRVNGLTGSGTVTEGRGVSIDNVAVGTTRKGIQIASPSSGANNYAIYSSAAAQSVHAGNLRIGSTVAPTVALDVTGAAKFSSTVSPNANDGAALGTTALQWSDLFLAEGGVINWDDGDATLTQVGNMVTLAGADLTVPNLVTSGNVDGVDVSTLASDVTSHTGATATAHGGTAWASWTPTWTSLTTTNATITTQYRESDDVTIEAFGKILFGAATDITGGFAFTPPVNVHADQVGSIVGTALLFDASTTTYRMAAVYANTASQMLLYTDNTTGLVNNTTPWDWTNLDFITWVMNYKKA